MTVHIARFHTCVSVLVLALLLSAGPAIAQEDTAPAEKPPAAQPTEQSPAAKPAEAVPVAKPTEEPPAPKPAEPEPVAKPTEEAPAVKPAEAVPVAKPTEEAPAAKPAEKPPAPKPAEAVPVAKPTEVAPATKPAEEPPPAPKATEEPPAPKPAEETPPAKPIEETPAEKPADETSDTAPVEAAMDESETPVAEEVVEGPPSFADLGEAEVAQQLGLSGEQKGQIAELLEERATALAEAPEATEEERAAIIESSEKKLAAVLTEVQRGDFLGKPVEKRLRFMFRFQQWDEVLQWFAQQAEMSLVLDRPPPGTFNYTDTREYTPKEAIDMLNGVLITKGFTLIRRGRMLMVIDLTKDIPEGLVQQVALEDIDKYGKFELVTVQFSLGRRSSTSVETAIKPVLSPYHKIVSVAATAQMFVTDKAGSMQAVSEIIEAIPEPVIRPTPTPSKPEPPVVEVYPLTNADPDTALTVLQAMVPTGTLVLDPKLKQINAHATPTQQSLIKQVLERMESATTEEVLQTLELYPVESFLEVDTTGSQLLETLQPAVADAQLSINTEKKMLVAWATPAEHEKIKSVIEKLQVVPTPRKTAQLEIHRLFRVDPETTLSLFQTILPDARLAVDTKTRNLIAVAVPDDQEVIRSTLKTLQPTEPGPDTPELRYYELTLAMPPDFPEVIQKVDPNATVALDQSGMRLMVIASPAEHARVDKTIQNMEKTTFVQGRPKLVFYPVTPAQRRRFDSVWQSLSKELPGVSLVTDGAPGELAIWGRPHQHEVIVEIMEELKRDVPEVERFLLQAYPIKSDDPSGVVSMLETLYPETKIVSDVGGERLLVWTDPQEHESIKKSLEELKVTGSEATPTVDIYPLTKADPTSTLTLLQSLVPEATISVDANSENIVALATAEDHLTIKTTMEKLQPDEPDVNKPQLQFYAFPKEPPANLVTVLQGQTPRAEITVDSENKRLVVLATPSDHEAIRSTIDKYQEATPADGQPELAVYPIRSADAASALTLLQNLVPDAQLSLDAKSENIHVVAVAEDQEAIKKAIETLESAAAGPDAAQLQFYPFLKEPPANLVLLLQAQSPKANITVDAEKKRLVVLASPTDQETVKSIIEKYQDASPSDEEAELVVYPIKNADPTSAMTLLQKLTPDAELTLDTKNENLSAIAVPSDHEIIKKTLDTLETAAAGPDTPQLQFYPFPRGPPAELVSILQTQSPKANITVESDNKRLVVLATPSDHEAIKAIIQKYEEATPDDGEANLAVYPIKSADPTSAMTLLQNLAPDAQLSLDAESENLIAVAIAKDHDTITKALETLESAAAGSDASQMQFYAFDEEPPANLTTILQTLAPKSQITLDAENKRLVVVATTSDHEKIKATVDQFQEAVQAKGKPELTVYPIKSADPTSVLSMLQQLYPNEQILLDSTSKRLLVWAKAEDQASIKASLEQLTGASPMETPQLEIYRLTKADPTATLTLLQKLVPDAQLTLDSNTNSLIALAVPADQQIIKSTIEQLQPAATDPDATTLQFHPLSREPSDNLVSVLQNLAPQAQITADTENERLMVVATTADHEMIKGVIEQFEASTPPEEKGKLAVYPVTQAQRRRFEAALATLTEDLPSVQLLPTSEPGELAIWAKPTDHLQVLELLKQLEADVPLDEKPQLMAYTLKAAEPAAVAEVLTKLFPDIEVVTDEKTRKVMVWALPADQPRISAAVQQIDSGEPGQWEQIFKAHAVPNADLTVALQMVQQLLPEVTFTSDTTAGTILAWAAKADHDKIAKMLEELQAGSDKASTAVVYTLEEADVTSIVTFLGSAFPNARFSAGTQPGQVVAWANSKDHEQIKTLIEQMAQGPSSDGEAMAAVYHLKSITAASAEPILQTAVPKANITVSADNPKRLIVWARPSEQETIDGILKEIDVEGDVELSSKAVVYTIEGMDASGISYALTFLSGAFPEARFTQGVESGQVVAWALPKEHEQIKTLVDQLSQKSTSEVSVYTLKSITAASAIEVLQSALPQAKFTADAVNPRRLTAWASQADHEKIKTILEKIDVEGTADPDAPQLQLYPLDQEPPASLVTILQSLAPEAEVTADAENKRLAVLASPADHEKIKAAVDQFQQASLAKGKPVLAVYKIRSADPQSVLSMLQTLYPKQQFVLDAKTNRLMVWASSEDQKSITESLEQITGSSGDQQSRFQPYPIRGITTAADAATLVSTLQPLVPDAKLTVGADFKNLIVWATPTDHEVIRQAVEQLGHGASAQNTPQLEVYRLTKANPDTTLALLQKLVPDAQLSLDPQTNNLISLAVPRDQQVIKATLEQLQPGASGPDMPELRFHSLSREPTDDLVSVLKELVPQAQITADAENKRLTVVATPEDHDAIKKVVDEYEASTPPEERGTLMIYPATPAQQRRFEAALGQLSEDLPSVQVLPNSELGELAIWAVPTEHIQVAELLKRLEGDVSAEEKPRLAAYTLKSAEPAAVSEVLTKLFPDVEVVIDEKTKKVMVWARLADQARISEAIEQIDAGKPGEWEETFKAYPLPDADTTVATQMLQQLLPDVRFSSDATAGTILAWGTKRDHETIAQMLEEMQAAPAKASTAVVYTLEGADATNTSTIVTFLGTAFPNARFTPGAQPGQLVAWASSKDQEQIKSLIDQLTEGADGAPKVAVYDLKSVTSASAQQILQTAVPQATITVDPENPQRLTVWARPSEHETIAGIVQEIDVEGDAELTSQAVVYSLKGMDATGTLYAVRFLTTALPKARFTQGVEPGQVVAWASAKDHQQIKTLVDQLTQESSTDVAVYSLKSITAASALEVLQTAVPQAKLTVDSEDAQRLTALAKSEEHEAIEKILETIDVEGATDSAAKAVIYTLDRMDASAASYAVSFLTTAFPKARFVTGARPGQLVAWATPKDHAEIKSLIDQMTQEPDPEDAPKVAVYDLKFITPASAQQILQTAVPQGQFTVDADNPKRLTVWARLSEHETIAGIVQEIDIEGDAEPTSQAVVYSLEGMDATGTLYAVRFLTAALPKARFTQGVEPGQVVAWASAKDHQQIKTLVDQLTQESSTEVAVYSLKSITAASALEVLQTAVPQAKLTVDTDDPQRLTALAKSEEHEAIKKILETIDVEGATDSAAKAVIYTLDRMDANAASYAVSFLTTAFPKARFVTGARPGQVVAWATPKDHAEIKNLIDQMTQEPDPEDAPKVAVYDLKFITPASAQQILQTAVPQATITVDPENPQRLSVWARPSEHETIAGIVQEIDIEGDAEPTSQAVVYSLNDMDATGTLYAVNFLTSAFPKARFTRGVEPGQVVAWASAKEHQGIKTLVDQLTQESSTDVAVYSLKSITAASALEVLQSAVPQAKLTVDVDDPQRLTALAKSEDHETIKKILETIDVEGATDSAAQAVIYTLDRMDASGASYAVSLLTTAFPRARFVTGARPGHVVAWATPKDHMEIKNLIDQMVREPDPELAPKVGVYDLKSITPTSAQQILQTAVPQAQFTVDAENPQRLTAWARPSEHETIAGIVQEIDVEGDVESSSKAVVYTLEGVDSSGSTYIIPFLTNAFPKAQFSQGVELGQVVAWASAKDHEQIKALIDQLAQASPDTAPAAAVYSLKFITATEAMQFLQTAVPQAQFTPIASDPQRMTAWARPSHQEAIKNVLEIIDVESDVDSSSKAVIYTIKGMDSSSGLYKLRFLSGAFPNANFTLGAEGDQIVAWASAKDHEQIKSLIDQFGEEAASEIVVYSLKDISATNASSVLQTAVPQAKITVDADNPQRLTAWARQEDHDAIQKILTTIDIEGDADAAATVVVYKLEGMSRSGAIYAVSFLSTTFPKARFTAGVEAGQVVAWASAKDHGQIKALVDQMTKEPESDVVVYSLKSITATNAMPVLQSAVPKAKLTADADDPQRLTAVASPEDHEAIKKILETIDVEGTADSAAKAVIYTIKGMDTTSGYYKLRFLSRAFPNASFVQGTEGDQIVAWATAKDHEKIRALIDQFGEEAASEIVVYSLKNITAANASTVLQKAVPQAEITVDADNPQRMTAWARQEDHSEIEKILAAIDIEGAADSAATAVIYTLQGVDTYAVTYAVRFLTTAFPKARIVSGAQAGQVVAWATPKDHAEIKSLIDQMSQGPPKELAPKLTVYGLKSISAADASQVLQTAVPQAKFTVSTDDPQRLSAWARPSEHETIAAILLELDVEGDPDSSSTAVVYTMEGMTYTGTSYAVGFLTTSFPRARFTAGATPGQIVAWASAKDHEQIKTLVDQMTEEPESEVAVYSLKAITAASATQVLQSAVPNAKLTTDAEDPQRLTAVASAEDHEAIKKIIATIDVEGAVDSAAMAVIYTIKGMDTRSGYYKIRFLSSAFPNASFTLGAEGDQVVAWATAKDQEKIKKLIDQFGEEAASELVVYSLKNISGTNASSVLRTAVPQAEITVDADNPQRLTAWARQEDHDTIQKVLATIDIEDDADSSATVAVYKLEGMTSTGAIYAVRFLTSTFPKARFTVGAQPGQVVAWASTKDHVEIKALVDQMTEEPESNVAVYSLKAITAASAVQVLQSAVPNAKLTADTDDPQRLTAVGSAEDHVAIKKIIETIDVEGAADSVAAPVIYTMKGMDARSGLSRLSFLGTAFPNASFAQGAKEDQIVAWATAKDHERIKSLIDQFDEEAASEVIVYSLKNISASDATNVLQTAVPQAEITVGTDNPQRLTAWARPEDHDAIHKILTTIDVEDEADASATVVVYTLRSKTIGSAVYAVRFLTETFPKARFTLSVAPGKVVTWASAKDHEEIKTLVDKINEEPESDVAVYSLKSITAASAIEVLQSAVPEAKLTADTDDPQRLTAWAEAGDHETIKKVLDTIDVEGDADSAANAVIYTLERTDATGASYAVSFLTSAFPNARFVSGAQPGQLVAWATPKDHTEIKSLIDQLSQGPPEELAPKVAVYGLKFISAADASQVLQSAVPQAQFTVSTDDPQRLAAWARPSEHETISAILQELDIEGDADSTSKAVVYMLEGMDAVNSRYVVTFLTSAFPKARFSTGVEAGQVVAWASAKDHQEIKALVEQLTHASPESALKAAVYSLKFITATTATQFLQTAVPQAKFTSDPEDTQRLTAWARPPHHDTIKNILEIIDVEGDADSSAKAVIYTLKGMDYRSGIYKLRFLASAFPKANFTMGAETDQIVAWATAKDHEEIKSLIEQFGEEAASEIVVYTLKNISAANASGVLSTAVPQAELTVDTEDPQRLTAWARATDHDSIKMILEKIDIESDPTSGTSVVIYTLDGMDARNSSYTYRFLSLTFPKARFTLGTQPGQLVAWASAKDHEEIKALIEQLNQGPPPEDAPKATVYTVKNITAQTAVQVLTSAVPMARLSVDAGDPQRLTAWARPSEHQMIDTILQSIDVEGDPDSAAKAVVYTMEGMSTQTVYYALRFLARAFPGAQFTPGAQADQLVAWATAKDHERIQSLIDQLGQEAASEIVVYTLKHISATNASGVLRTAVPQAQVTTDTENPQRLTAWARATDHEAIKTILDRIDVEADPASAATVMIYMLEGMDPRYASYTTRFLFTTFPKARFTMGTQPGQLIVWASAKDHEEIKALIDQLNQGPPEGQAPTATVYTVKNITAADAMQVLQAAVPQAKLSPTSDDPQRLTAFARPSEHEMIDAILKEIDVEGDAEYASKAVVYTLEGMDSQSALYTLSFLGQAFPDAQFTRGAEADQVVAWASGKDHEKIGNLVEQLGREGASEIVLYTLKNISATSASSVLRTAVPQAEITVDTEDPQRLTAWARATDHDAIKTILEKIDVEPDPESAASVVIYTLEAMDPGYASYTTRFLLTTFPKARFTMGTEPGQLIAWASAKDHEGIKELVDQLNQGPPPDKAPKAAVYAVKNISAADALQVLQTAVPQANFSPATDDPQRLTAFARPSEHEMIETILAEIDVEGDPDAASKAVVYTLEGMDSGSSLYTLRFLGQAFPDAQFTQGAQADQVVAWASAKDHARIEDLVEQLGRETASEIIVYTLKNISASSAVQVLQTAVPEAELTVDATDPQRLTAWARAVDHDSITAILDKIDVEADPESAARVAVYVLEGMSQTHAIYSVRFLQQAVPDAKLTLGADTTQLIAWASPKDHETIKELVKQLLEESPDSARTAKVYNLQHATAENAIPTLSAAVPDATLNVGADPSQLIAWARANEHEKIDTIIQQLETKGPPETEPQAIVYTVPMSNATEAIRILRETVPQAKLTIGSEPHQLIAWARPADHEVIQQLVEKMGEKGPDELAPRVAVYKVEAGEAVGAIAFLQAAVPNADFSVGSDPRRLIAWASPADHEVIKKAIDELTLGADQISTHVYRFEYADPAAAEAVLSALVPAAKIALDQNDGSLVVSAMPDDHAKIQATIDEMDSEDAGGQRPVVQVHRIMVGDPTNVYQSLAQLFARDTNVQLSLDEQNDAVIAVAPAAKHKRIDEMIQAVAAVAQEDDDTTVELHSMKNVDSSAAMDVLDQLLAKQSSKADVSYDYGSNQLVAIGRPEDHELIKRTLDQLRTEETVLEIYELQYVDPMSAEIAIGREFAEEGLNGPRVDTDPITEQLFIRATAEQQKKIRDLLIKMGETKLKLLKGRSGQIMRTYRTQGDISEALREIQRLWPKLRDNEIRIMSPDAPLPADGTKKAAAPSTEDPPVDKTEPAQPAKPKAPQPKTAEKAEPAPPVKPKTPAKELAAKAKPTPSAKRKTSQPKPDKPNEAPRETTTPDKPAEAKAEQPKANTPAKKDASKKTALLDDSAWGDDWYFVAQIKPDGAAETDAARPKSPPVAEKPPTPEPPKPAAPDAKQAAKTGPGEVESKPPPLYVVPGEGSITVVSDDPEALQQFEQLLRTILPAAAQIGRNISVFPLENSNAAEVAERLQQLFDSDRSSWRRGALPVAIVPDERLNTIVVQGSRIDRETIEGLVRVLDSEQGEGTKPQIVPLRYADAVEVSKMIQEVFRSQLMSTTSSSRSRTYGTSTSRRRPGVAVDEMTNSLVVMATSPLLEEIIELAQTLDERAGESPARQIKIIPLKKASASRVEEALQRILNPRSGTTRRAR